MREWSLRGERKWSHHYIKSPLVISKAGGTNSTGGKYSDCTRSWEGEKKHILSGYHTWSAVHTSHSKVLFDNCDRVVLRYHWVPSQLLPVTQDTPEKIYLFFSSGSRLLVADAIDCQWSISVRCQIMEEQNKKGHTWVSIRVRQKLFFPQSADKNDLHCELE